MSSDVEYHLHRARSERDTAYRSADQVAADIHMQLSALHLAQALLLQTVRRQAVGNVVPFPAAPPPAYSALPPVIQLHSR